MKFDGIGVCSLNRLRASSIAIASAPRSLLENQGESFDGERKKTSYSHSKRLVELDSPKPTTLRDFKESVVAEQTYKIFALLRFKVWNSAETCG